MTGTKRGFRRRRVLVDKKLQVGLSLHIIGYVYFYLVLFALIANFTAITTVLTGGDSDQEYIQAVHRLKLFMTGFLVAAVRRR